MSRIADLLAELCPDGVPFKTLGEVGEFIRGSGLQKSDLADAGAPAIHYGQIHTHYGTWATETKSFVREALAARLRQARPGDLVIATTSEDDDAVAKATAWIGDSDVAVSGDAYIYRHTLEPKYVAYFFQSEQFRGQKKRHITGTKLRRLSSGALAKIRVPVPPAEVQREVVRVLDILTELVSELKVEVEAELDARHRQYEHYRDTLLSFRETEGVRWLPLAKVGTFTRGRRFVKDDIVDYGLAAIHYGEIYTHYGTSADTALSHVRPQIASRLRFAEPGDVVIAAVGETVEDVGKAVAWLGDGPVAVHDDCFTFSHAQNPKFIAYCLQTAALNADKDKHVSRAKVERLSADGLGRLVVPVPPLDEQARIVAILDEFDALVKDLSVGLPAELKARRQQYEYYRGRLLTFEESVA